MLLNICYTPDMNINLNKDTLKKFLEDLADKDQFSGAVLVTQNNQTAFEYVSGFANKEKEIKNTIDTQFNIGSMDKMFTSICIASLVEKKLVSFDDFISKYIPDVPSRLNTMTIHHLLTHQEGLPSYFNNNYIEKRLELKTVDDYIRLFIEDPLLFEPGERYSYSNSGFILLGSIIEKVTGQSYYEHVKEIVFEKAEMTKTGSIEIINSDQNIALGYTNRKVYSQQTFEGEKRENTDDLPFRGGPAGGGYSTVKDLTKFAQALMNNKLLTPEMTRLVTTPKIQIETKNNTTLCYGYGFQLLKYSREKIRIGHGGGFAGVNARLDIYPWLDTVVVVLSNYDPPSGFRVANKISEYIV